MNENKDNIKFAIIAGDGELPIKIFEHFKDSNNLPAVIAVKGFAKLQDFQTTEKAIFSMAEVGGILKFLKKHKVKNIVFAGGVQRPDFKNLKPDFGGIALLIKIKAKMLLSSNYGDDKLLDQVINHIESKGFKVVSPQSLLHDLTLEVGLKTNIKPSREAEQDILKTVTIIKKFGEFDIGQAMVIEQGSVIAVEAAEGTDNLIVRAGLFKKNKDKSGVLVKCKKPTQSERVDMPTIGLDTVKKVSEANLEGIAIESGKVYVLNQNKIFDEANQKGIFIKVF